MCVCGTRVFGKHTCMASNRVVWMGWDGMGCEREKGGFFFTPMR